MKDFIEVAVVFLTGGFYMYSLHRIWDSISYSDGDSWWDMGTWMSALFGASLVYLLVTFVSIHFLDILLN